MYRLRLHTICTRPLVTYQLGRHTLTPLQRPELRNDGGGCSWGPILVSRPWSWRVVHIRSFPSQTGPPARIEPEHSPLYWRSAQSSPPQCPPWLKMAATHNGNVVNLSKCKNKTTLSNMIPYCRHVNWEDLDKDIFL